MLSALHQNPTLMGEIVPSENLHFPPPFWWLDGAKETKAEPTGRVLPNRGDTQDFVFLHLPGLRTT